MLNEHGGRLRAIASRYGNASTPPWKWGNEGLQHSGPMRYLVLALPYAYTTEHRAADLEFIENAPDDMAFLLNLVAQLEQDLARSERRLAEVTEAAGRPGEGLQQAVNVQPLLDRAAALETALQVVAAREVINSMARQELAALVTLAHDAWGLIAAAENFKHNLVGGTAEPIGPREWRNAATQWRDRFHVLTSALPAEHAPAVPDPHAMCASEVVKIRGDSNRLADELERVRDAYRQQQANHEAERARWQPQIDELTIERDAAARDRRAAEVEAERLREELRQLEAEQTDQGVRISEYHAQMRKQITDAHEETAKVAEELAATQRAKRENDERFQLQAKELQEQLAVATASEAVGAVAAYALLREAATVLQRPAGQDLGREQRRDLLARIGIVIGEDLQPQLPKAVTHWPPAATPYGGCPASLVDGGRTIWCGTPWPHQPLQSENGDFDHGNEAEGVLWNIDRSCAPQVEPDLRHPWTLGHLRRTVDAYPDFADDAFVQATVPNRPIGWAHDGSNHYTHDLLGLHVQDPREFL